ncbi:anti-phage protein KwaB [Paenibacillus tarimensis]
MSIEELKDQLRIFFQNEEGLLAEVYFILKGTEGTYLRMADIHQDTQKELTTKFIEKVRDDIINKQELNLIKISDADDRTNVIYEYDLEETPSELNVISDIIQNDNFPHFSFNQDKLNDLKGFVILISNNGQNLVLYKKHYPVELFRKDSGFSLTRLGNNQRFVKLKEDIVRISSYFEFFNFNDTLFINNLNALEKFFGFHDAIKKRAKITLDQIKEYGILENPDELEEMIDDITYSRKLTKVGNSSPVLGRIPTNEVINFVENFPGLQGAFEFNDDRSKIKIGTKKSKQMLIKLLNDDYLHSQLTRQYYDSLAKDAVSTT